MFFSDSLLITYKGKLLLTTRDLIINDHIKNVWGFLGEGKLKKNSKKNSVAREITDATKLTLNDIEVVELADDADSKVLYHAKLTDDDVNCIVRRSGERLEFYDMNELDNLTLTQATNSIISKNRQKLLSLISE